MNNHQLKLIDSTYSAKDAKEVLLSLINDKIRFLSQKIVSIEERFGGDTSHLEKRVQQLTQERSQLITLFEHHENEDHLVEVDCNVHFSIKQMQSQD